VVAVNGSAQYLQRAGRKPGSGGKATRVLKQALIYAAEKSKHSKSSNLEGYCIWLADDRPELFVSLLGRLLPIQARVEMQNSGGSTNINMININMPLSEMVSTFEQRIMSAYTPAALAAPDDPDAFIEHMDPEDDA